MPRPPKEIVVAWRNRAHEGATYAEIQRAYSDYTVHQIRHACLGNTGKDYPGPIQQPHRWKGANPWLHGQRSPRSRLTREQALQILDDWDEEEGEWRNSGAEWARRLGVSRSAVYMLRRGETWRHLRHPNQGLGSRPD